MDIQPYHEQDHRELFQGANANKIVYAHDLAGNFTFLNHTGEAISGYSRSEICRMNIAELVPAEIADSGNCSAVGDPRRFTTQRGITSVDADVLWRLRFSERRFAAEFSQVFNVL